MSQPALAGSHDAGDDPLAARVLREQDAYDIGLKRDRYDDVLSHCQAYWHSAALEYFRRALCASDVNDALEIGSHGWDMVFTDGAQPPQKLHCINISEAELDTGRRKAAARGLSLRFSRMDAHALEFPDASFDVVFGFGILHHLDYERALDEVRRILRPGGTMIFNEPLDINPIGAVVRWATPSARTIDEAPLKLHHLDLFRERFDMAFHPQQFLSVPFGVLSRAIMKSPRNPMMRAAYDVDRCLARVPGLRFWFRKVVLIGVKPHD